MHDLETLKRLNDKYRNPRNFQGNPDAKPPWGCSLELCQWPKCFDASFGCTVCKLPPNANGE